MDSLVAAKRLLTVAVGIGAVTLILDHLALRGGRDIPFYTACCYGT
jgi:hypothetical protein